MPNVETSNTSPFRVAWWLTIGILLGFLILVVWKGLPNNINEIGDAIAGPAALLAFIWLIVTVRLQHTEMVGQSRISEDMYGTTKLQTELLQKSTEATLKEVNAQLDAITIERVKFIRSEEGFHRERQDSAVSQLLNQLVYLLFPMLEKIPVMKEKMLENCNLLQNTKLLIEGRQYDKALISTYEYVAKTLDKFCYDKNKAVVLPQLLAIPNLREAIEMVNFTLIKCDFAVKDSPAKVRHLFYPFQIDLIEEEISWLFELREELPTTLERFQKQLEKARQDLRKDQPE